MVGALFDSCILIDFLNGVEEARSELQNFDDAAMSIISWMEVMAGATPDTESPLRAFLGQFAVLTVSAEIAERAVQIRKDTRLRLPDAIIRATAETSGRLLVTRDEKAFDSRNPGIRIPYRLAVG